MLKRDKYEDRQEFKLMVGRYELVVERIATFELATGNRSIVYRTIRAGGFNLHELATATALAIDAFIEVTVAICERTSTGEFRPLNGPYGMMQLWSPVSIFANNLESHVFRSKYIRFSAIESGDVTVYPQDLPDGNMDNIEAVFLASELKKKALGIEVLSPAELGLVMSSGYVRPSGSVPVLPRDHLLVGVMFSLMQCPIQKGVIPVHELDRLRKLSKIVRELFSLPEDLISQEAAAQIGEIDSRTVRNWITKGSLPSYGEERQISESEFRKLLPSLRKRRPRSGSKRTGAKKNSGKKEK